MDNLRFTEDPHSFAKPELARVINTELALTVDFNQEVLRGKAILTIQRKPSINKIFLDSYKLGISSVTDLYGKPLKYYVGIHHAFGSLIHVELPSNNTSFNKYKIQIQYATTPDSPALFWLKREQTADGKHPFLLSNNKLIYARSWFPCQDTPSVKFTYTAKISVPKNVRVLMSALLKNICVGPELDEYEFRQKIFVPSYAVVIAVGSLEKRELNDMSNIFAESGFINESFDTFRSGINTIESMLKIAKSLCGPYIWGRYDICVLPPSIGHFEIECPCMTFISPILLRGDSTSISSFAPNISQCWAGHLVTCSNYEHLWMNKSFSIFISRKIISKLFPQKDMKSVLEREGLSDLKNMIEDPTNVGLIKCLLPKLEGMLPHEAAEYVPYEAGCILLNHLENKLGGSSVFEPFLNCYFVKFRALSINTQDWMDYLYQYFLKKGKKEILDGVEWNRIFNVVSPPNVPERTAWETKCFKLAEEWVNWDCRTHGKYPCDAEKIIVLTYLYSFHTKLTENKLKSIYYCLLFQNAKIRCLWLLLCIKIRWAEKVEEALKYAIKYCSPTIACPIFEHLYEWTEMRAKVIEVYNRNKGKMLYETQELLADILHLK